MKKVSRRSFLRGSALAGAAVLASAVPVPAMATSTVATGMTEQENCLDQIGTTVASLGNTSPTLPAVVGLPRGYVMGYRDNGIYTFRGIPYGTHQRFKYATPVESYGTAEQPTNALTKRTDYNASTF